MHTHGHPYTTHNTHTHTHTHHCFHSLSLCVRVWRKGVGYKSNFSEFHLSAFPDCYSLRSSCWTTAHSPLEMSHAPMCTATTSHTWQVWTIVMEQEWPKWMCCLVFVWNFWKVNLTWFIIKLMTHCAHAVYTIHYVSGLLWFAPTNGVTL